VARQDLLEHLEMLAHPVMQAVQVQMVSQDPRDPLEVQEHQDQLDSRVLQDQEVRLDLVEPLELLEQLDDQGKMVTMEV